MGYLFDNQVTKEEFDAIAHEVTDMLMDVIVKNMHNKVESELRHKLDSYSLLAHDSISVTYTTSVNREVIDMVLSRMRRTGEQPIPKKFKMISDFWGLRSFSLKKPAK